MKQLPKSGPIAKVLEIAGTVSRMNIPEHAGYGCYFIILSAFPALLLILSTLRYTGLTVEDLLGLLDNLLPSAIMETIEELIYSTYANASGAITGLSAVMALWSSSRGMYGLLIGMNAVYNVREDRGVVYTRGISVLYALGFYVVILLTLALHVYGGTIYNLLLGIDNAVVIFLLDILDLRFIFLLVIQTALFTAMYMVLPNRHTGFLQCLPGGLLSAIGWLVFSDIYSLYVEHFSGYSNIYGSVYTLAIAMLWLYSCLNILLYGGALNSFLLSLTNGKNVSES